MRAALLASALIIFDAFSNHALPSSRASAIFFLFIVCGIADLIELIIKIRNRRD